jgi:hypothetical protein
MAARKNSRSLDGGYWPIYLKERINMHRIVVIRLRLLSVTRLAVFARQSRAGADTK